MQFSRSPRRNRKTSRREPEETAAEPVTLSRFFELVIYVYIYIYIYIFDCFDCTSHSPPESHAMNNFIRMKPITSLSIRRMGAGTASVYFACAFSNEVNPLLNICSRCALDLPLGCELLGGVQWRREAVDMHAGGAHLGVGGDMRACGEMGNMFEGLWGKCMRGGGGTCIRV